MKVGFFNRLIFVLAAVIILAVCVIMFSITDLAQLFDYGSIKSTVDNSVEALYSRSALIPAAIGIFLGLVVCVWLFVLGFKKNSVEKTKPIEYIKIGAPENGQIKIATSTVNSMICKNIAEISGVINPRAKTIVSEDKTYVTVGVSVEDGVVIPKVCEEIQTTTKEKIQQLTGMEIQDINILVNNKA